MKLGSTHLTIHLHGSLLQKRQGRTYANPKCHSDAVELLKLSRVKFSVPRLPEPNDSVLSEQTHIENLCWSLKEAQLAREHLEISLSLGGKLSSCRHSDMAMLDFHLSSQRKDVVTLKDLLRKSSHQTPQSRPWNLMQRMKLSLNLASSLLQLCSTPWAWRKFTNEGICFLQESTQTAAASNIEADQPFITHIFRPGASAALAREQSIKDHLLDLGIVLLEIWLETLFESWAATAGVAVNSSYGARYSSAKKWLSDTAGDILPLHHGVILRCIECAFPTDSSYQHWDDQALKRAVCEKVIIPLHDSVK